MQIRTPTREDEAAVVDELLRPSYRESAEVAPAFNELDQERVAEADCGRWLDRDDRVLFVADRDGTLVGHVSGILTDAPPIYARGRQLHIDGLYVKPRHRRTGVASALVDRIEAWADARGCDYVGTTAHVDNDAANRLFEGRFDLTFYSYRATVD